MKTTTPGRGPTGDLLLEVGKGKRKEKEGGSLPGKKPRRPPTFETNKWGVTVHPDITQTPKLLQNEPKRRGGERREGQQDPKEPKVHGNPVQEAEGNAQRRGGTKGEKMRRRPIYALCPGGTERKHGSPERRWAGKSGPPGAG